MEEVIPSMLVEIRGRLEEKMIQVIIPTVGKIINDIFPTATVER